ncbi:hypothetical protein C8F01DRAFT_1092601 [Mycena amicta]|nr:hypothetical protein C8F01DRAFT_1092601 [Mycena amicta]
MTMPVHASAAARVIPSSSHPLPRLVSSANAPGHQGHPIARPPAPVPSTSTGGRQSDANPSSVSKVPPRTSSTAISLSLSAHPRRPAFVEPALAGPSSGNGRTVTNAMIPMLAARFPNMGETEQAFYLNSMSPDQQPEFFRLLSLDPRTQFCTLSHAKQLPRTSITHRRPVEDGGNAPPAEALQLGPAPSSLRHAIPRHRIPVKPHTTFCFGTWTTRPKPDACTASSNTKTSVRRTDVPLAPIFVLNTSTAFATVSSMPRYGHIT